MAELASRTAAGGAIGDTFGDNVIARIFVDGVYAWIDRASASDLADVAPDLASRKVIGAGETEAQDGYRTRVTTNGLTYIVVDGAYQVDDYEITVADLAARDALTEMETGQRVYIDSLDRTDRFDGTNWVEGAVVEGLVNTIADLVDPTTVTVGAKTRVVNDPVDSNNGVFIALGANVGSNATYWENQN